mmetsp:Transcript_7454/g.9250  ORF Transcript_7454/g.9250 Transcript_7454/m.9250 type:complete len:435 (-) Transcript_7454:852-2156(-)
MKSLLCSISKNITSIDNLLQYLGMSSLHVLQESSLKSLNMLHINTITVTLHTNEQCGNNLLWLIWFILTLLEEFIKPHSTVKLLLGGSIQIRTEFGEGCNLTVLGKLELHGTGNSLGSLVLCGGTYTGHGETNGDSWTLTLVEQLGLKEDLSVRNGNHIGWDVGRYITGLGLNDGKGGKGSSAGVTVHLGRTFEEAGVEVENITWVSFTSWRTTEEEGHLTVCNSLLGQIIVEDHSVLSVVTEVFSHGSSGVGCEELKWGRIGCSGGYNDTVVHGFLLIKLSYELGDGGTLLSNSNVDTGERVGLGLLVNNGINGDGGLTRLTISNDKLTLSTPNWDEGINGLKTSKHRLGDRLPGDDTWSLDLSTGPGTIIQTGPAINRLSNTIYYTAEQLLSNRNIHNRSGTLNRISLEDITIISENHHSNVILLKVKRHTA